MEDQLHVTCYFISVLMCSTFSDINISIIMSLRLFCSITTLIVLQASACCMDTTPTQPHRNSNTHWTKNNTTYMVIQQNSRKLLMMDILMSETCWAYKKWNKIASDIMLVFYSSTITMMHSPINISIMWSYSVYWPVRIAFCLSYICHMGHASLSSPVVFCAKLIGFFCRCRFLAVDRSLKYRCPFVARWIVFTVW